MSNAPRESEFPLGSPNSAVPPPLVPSAMRTKECSLCRYQAEHLCIQRVLNKHDVEYFRCSRCDLIQTATPYWFEEAPWSSISHLDTGAVMRNSACARVTTAIGHVVGLDANSRCLDYGAGYGLFVRTMRDHGLNFLWHDKYGPNVFARGSEGEPSTEYDLVTCFELFEHLPDVREGIDPILGAGHELILVGTVLHTGHKHGWWYYVPELGGHVSFFSEHTMHYVGEQWGYRALCSPAYTLFVRRDRSLSKREESLLKRILHGSRVASSLLSLGPRYQSLVADDYARLLIQYLAEAANTAPSCQPDAAVSGTVRRQLSRRQRARKVLAVGLAQTADTLVPSACERTLGRVCTGTKEMLLGAGLRAIRIFERLTFHRP